MNGEPPQRRFYVAEMACCSLVTDNLHMGGSHPQGDSFPYWELRAPSSSHPGASPSSKRHLGSGIATRKATTTTNNNTHPQIAWTWDHSFFGRFSEQGLSYSASWKIKQMANVNTSCFLKNMYKKKKKWTVLWKSIDEALTVLGNTPIILGSA